MLVGLILTTGAARGAVLLDYTSALSSTDAKQFSRLSRNSIASDWGDQKPFPGVLGTPGPRAYEQFLINPGYRGYLQVSLDDPSATLQAAAYNGAFLPTQTGPNYGLNVNYLGDAGSSQPFGNPSFFQVVAQGRPVIVIVNEVNSGQGLGQSFNLLVEGFADPNFSEVPEPATALPLGVGLVGTVILRQLRRGRA